MVDGDTWSWSVRDGWCSAHARTQSLGASPVRSSQWLPSTRTSLNPAVIVITLKSTFQTGCTSYFQSSSSIFIHLLYIFRNVWIWSPEIRDEGPEMRICDTNSDSKQFWLTKLQPSTALTAVELSISQHSDSNSQHSRKLVNFIFTTTLWTLTTTSIGRVWQQSNYIDLFWYYVKITTAKVQIATSYFNHPSVILL